MLTARDSVVGCSSASTTRTVTPWRASWQAAVSPTGPAPTTSTSSIAFMIVSLRSGALLRDLSYVFIGSRLYSSDDDVVVGVEGSPQGGHLLAVESADQQVGVRAGEGLADAVERGAVGEQEQRRGPGDDPVAGSRQEPVGQAEPGEHGGALRHSGEREQDQQPEQQSPEGAGGFPGSVGGPHLVTVRPARSGVTQVTLSAFGPSSRRAAASPSSATSSAVRSVKPRSSSAAVTREAPAPTSRSASE